MAILNTWLPLISFTETIPFQQQDAVNQNSDIGSTEIVFQYSRQFLLGLYFYSGKELESSLWSLFEFLYIHKSTTCNQNIYEKSLNGFRLPADRSVCVYFQSVTLEAIACYPTTVTSRFWIKITSVLIGFLVFQHLFKYLLQQDGINY